MARDLREVRVYGFWRELVIKRRDNRDSASAHARICLTSSERLFNVGLCGAGEDRKAAAGLIRHYLDDPPPLLLGEPGELSG